jgi:uncharacterized membrane protein
VTVESAADSTAPTARPGVRHLTRRLTGVRLTRWRVIHVVAVGLITAVMAVGYSVFALVLNYRFQTSSYDLVIFDEAVRSYAHFHPGISPIKGLHNNFGANFSVLGDHWSPILASLAPLYWIHDSPTTLLVAQAVLFSLAIPWLWVFTRRAFGGGRRATLAAYLVAVAYLLSWPIASAEVFDFHEVAFAPVLMAIVFERLQAGKLRTALIASFLLLLVKEDMGLVVAGIGVYLLVSVPSTVRRQRIVGLGMIVFGLADTWIATYLLIPAFGGHASYYWAYGVLGRGVPQVAAHVAAHPLEAAKLMITPRVKLDTMLWLLAPCCFLPLLSPITIAVIPLLVERMMQDQFGNWWVTSYHYNAYLVIILACGGVDGAARLGRWLGHAYRASRPRDGDEARTAQLSTSVATVGLVAAVLMLAVGVYSVPKFALGQAFHRSFFHRTVYEKIAEEAVSAVPSGVTVEAVNYLGPQLSGRDKVLLWDGDGGTPVYAPWIIANTSTQQFTWRGGLSEQIKRVELLKKHGYKTVFDRGGYIVLKSPTAGSSAGHSG